MVRNIPAMWRLYKGFKNAKGTEEESVEKNKKDTAKMIEESSENRTSRKKTGQKRPQTSTKISSQRSSTGRRRQPSSSHKRSPSPKGSSVPKMYI
jgi:hypothetical protein